MTGGGTEGTPRGKGHADYTVGAPGLTDAEGGCHVDATTPPSIDATRMPRAGPALAYPSLSGHNFNLSKSARDGGFAYVVGAPDARPTRVSVWRPRRDLNPCYRRERPVS